MKWKGNLGVIISPQGFVVWLFFCFVFNIKYKMTKFFRFRSRDQERGKKLKMFRERE